MTLYNFFLKMGFSISRCTPRGKVLEFFSKIQPRGSYDLIRLGGAGDGGYWVPRNLEGIVCCFSPGVADCSDFEEDCAARGMEVFMVDGSVDGPASSNQRFHFEKKYLASFDSKSKGLLSLDGWYEKSRHLIPPGDLILQMDIEGAEYEVLHSISGSLLKKFRVVVVEFHHLHQLWNCNSFEMMSNVFEKLLGDFEICHLSPNPYAGWVDCEGLRFSRLIEATFVRKQ